MKTNDNHLPDNGVMLNAYPDSIGESLDDMIQFLKEDELKDVFSSLYILPSLFNTDLDHGFSIIDYELNELYATQEDIEQLKQLGLTLKLDFVLNHLSVLSPQFQDILKNGEQSEYYDFFIQWNRFWTGHGFMTPEGYIEPDKELIKNMFFRKPGPPILMVRFPDGKNVPYWNTFYQEVYYEHVEAQDLVHEVGMQYASAKKLAGIINDSIADGKKPGEIPFGRFEKYSKPIIEYLESRRKYLGQMDLNAKSPRVWHFYEYVINKLAEYGASIIRLDAFAYAAKEIGTRNFFNEPETFELLERIKEIADKHDTLLLPEIHATYREKTHEKIAREGYMTYDFFLPGLIIDALERKKSDRLVSWATELMVKRIRVVNMLGCHDGIPLLDLHGLLPKKEIDYLTGIIIGRGGIIDSLYKQKKMYYQVNATYYSALGEDDRKMLLARAIQLFMPGKPQVWYLDLFLGKNDHMAVKKAGDSGHREINRTRLSMADIKKGLKNKTVSKQLEMIRFRNTFPAFGFSSTLEIVASSNHEFAFCWKNNGYEAKLVADLSNYSFTMTGTSPDGKVEVL